MDLIYLYVGNIGRTVGNYGIRFSRQFYVDFNPKSGQLYITRKDSNSYSSIYGDNILDIDLVVGKNGSGKTTALNLLGLSKSEKIDEYPIHTGENILSDMNNKHTWFALYFIRDDYFAIEGYWCETLEFMRETFHLRSQPQYSFCFKYDFDKQIGDSDSVRYLQNFTLARKTDFHRKLFYLYYENPVMLDWVKPIKHKDRYGIDSSFAFERVKCEKNGYRGITKFLYDACHKSGLMYFLGTKPGTVISISVNRDMLVSDSGYFDMSTASDFVHLSDFGQLEIDEKKAANILYNGKLSLIKSFSKNIQNSIMEDFVWNHDLSYKDAFVISYLEQLIIHKILYQPSFSHKIDKKSLSLLMTPKTKQQTQYSWQKAYLFSVLKKLSGNYARDYNYATEIVKSLETIPAKFFVSYTEINVSPEKMKDNFLDKLMKPLDESSRNSEEYSISHKDLLIVEFKGISSGEARMIDIFAMLYNSIYFTNHDKNNTCVLLLDEPDIGFHPEWSRKFIEELTNFLKSDMMNKYNYHIIISTHSPIMISDVPKQCIHCISKNLDGKVEVKESDKYGLVSGINEVLIDTFYTNSLFGSFGEEYANTIIKQIKKLEDINQFGNKKLDEINNYILKCSEINDMIENLGEGYIKDCLLRRLQIQRNRFNSGLHAGKIDD